MNEIRCRASERVQRIDRNVGCTITSPTVRPLAPGLFEEEAIMLKTISAALLAVTMIAAPALAAGTGPVVQAPTAKIVHTSTVRHAHVKSGGALNANAQMRHHRRHHHFHHHHHRMGALKGHSKLSFKPVAKSHSKVSARHVAPVAKRG
jgi:hypothetical protein